jgi:S-adenosylmethionine decarboxylase
MHMTIDGYGGSEELLNNEQLVRELLDRYPGEIGMTKIAAPYVVAYDGADKPEDYGVTGFVIIAESHISIHTFPGRGDVWLDVFSCKDFDTEGATGVIVDAFNLSAITQRKLERGLEFPHAIEEATPIAMWERTDVTRQLVEVDAGS